MERFRPIRGLTCVKLIACALALSLAFSAGAPPDEKRPVQAKKPTVVTVEGARERVEPNRETEPPRNPGSKVGGAIKAGFTKAWKGVTGLTGWLLNTDDDIPSERERRESGANPPQR